MMIEKSQPISNFQKCYMNKLPIMNKLPMFGAPYSANLLRRSILVTVLGFSTMTSTAFAKEFEVRSCSWSMKFNEKSGGTPPNPSNAVVVMSGRAQGFANKNRPNKARKDAAENAEACFETAVSMRGAVPECENVTGWNMPINALFPKTNQLYNVSLETYGGAGRGCSKYIRSYDFILGG